LNIDRFPIVNVQRSIVNVQLATFLYNPSQVGCSQVTPRDQYTKMAPKYKYLFQEAVKAANASVCFNPEQMFQANTKNPPFRTGGKPASRRWRRWFDRFPTECL